jgi:4-amino-4-deoxy-L-arabinose transferase-like glycosyltransferase
MQRWIRIPEVQVGLVATILIIAAFAYYSHAGLLFVYGDAVSHLMIARRVLDSSTPGIAQLGTVWLPLNHILMLPLVWIDPLFRDGFAGAFPSMVAYVVAGVFMYKLTIRVLHSRLAGYVAAAVLLLNPSLLYLQSTSMSETDLICCTVLLAYFLVRWSETERLSDLILCAAACMAATLIRYDGWALTIAAAVYVLVTTWRRHGWIKARAVALLYGLLAFAGCAGWIIYNQMIFNAGRNISRLR